MPEFAPGAVVAGEALSRDRYRQKQIEEAMQMMAYRQMVMQQEQEAQRRAKEVPIGAQPYLPVGSPTPPPVQAVPPGQGSQPMQPPMQGPPPPSPAGPPGGGSPPAMGLPPGGRLNLTGPVSPELLQKALSDINATGGGAPSPQPAGWTPGKTATPALGGGIQRETQPGDMPTEKLWDVTEIIQKVPPEKRWEYAPYIIDQVDRHNKYVMDMWKLHGDKQRFLYEQAQTWDANVRAMKGEQELTGGGTRKLTAKEDELIFAAGGTPGVPLNQQPPGVVEKARQLALAEAKKGTEGGEKAPAGYRWSKTTPGALEFIEGGPADPKVIADKKNAIVITGGRESTFTNRVIQAANQASKDLANIVQLPLSKQTTGIFGGRHQGVGLWDANKEVMAQKMTATDALNYNVMATGLQRALAAVETSGLAQGIQEFSKQIDVVAKEGEPNITKLHKLAQIRQIIEAASDVIISNPRVPEEQKTLVRKMLDNVHAAVPFTHSDLISLASKQEINPNTTLKDVLQKTGDIREFATEAEAEAAGLKPGTRVRIGGQLGTWK